MLVIASGHSRNGTNTPRRRSCVCADLALHEQRQDALQALLEAEREQLRAMLAETLEAAGRRAAKTQASFRSRWLRRAVSPLRAPLPSIESTQQRIFSHRETPSPSLGRLSGCVPLVLH